MIEQFNEMAASIKEAAAGRRIVYIPNPGNYGDGLIRYGAKQFFADFDMRHIELNVGYTRVKYQLAPLLVKKHLYFFVYGGGGAWCDAYSFGRDYVKLISRFTDKFAVLPSTYALNDLPQKGLMYRRDNAESALTNPSAIFCHDMALYISCRPSNHGRSYGPALHHTGLFMRTDRETKFKGGSLPAGNVDLSLEGDHMSNGDDFLRRVAEFEVIYTDRLHVCIAACIAGRKVKLITGNYFKIKRIYEASIAPYFGDQVELLGEEFRPEDIPL